MNIFLSLAYLFFIGSLLGWGLEVFYRRFVSKANPERKWINPGFCTGPYLPLYGSGLCVLYLLASFGDNHVIGGPVASKIILFVSMAVSMTLVELIAGLISLKGMKVRLWDYTEEWGNFMGLICPKFSFYWAVISAGYYFGIHPHILSALNWLSNNLAFSFVIGFFFGVFAVDLGLCIHLAARMRAFAREHQVVIKYERFKAHVEYRENQLRHRMYFISPLYTARSIGEHLRDAYDEAEKLRSEHKNMMAVMEEIKKGQLGK